MQRIRVLVVDDHRIFAESLAAALAAEQDVDVSAAGSGPAALRSLERAALEGRRFDVVLVDARLGEPPHPAGPAAAAVNGHAHANGTGQGFSALGAGNGHGPPAPSPTVAAAAGGGAGGALPHGAAPGVAASLAGPPGAPGRPQPAGVRVARNGASGPASSVAAAPGLPGGPPRATAPLAPSGAPGQPAGAEDTAAGGIPLVARIRNDHPRVRTVVLADRDDPRHAAAALQAGAGGWVAKDSSLSRLLHVVRGVLKDETHLPPALLTGVLRELTASRRHRTESERLVESLTPREREVLRCMVAGLGRKAVAERLFLSPHTVRTHMQNVLGKLGVHSTLAAVALARRAGVGPAELGPRRTDQPSTAH